MESPPPLVLFSDISKYLSALDDDVRHEFEEEILTLHAKGLPPIVSIRALAVLFGIRSQFIGAICKRPSRYYRTFTIRSGKKLRRINAPRVAVKVIQKWMGHEISRNASFSDSVYGFVPGKSAIAAANVHCGASWVFSTDIHEFFASTSESCVSQGLQAIGYSARASELVARLSSLDGFLAQGSPASPVLSNIAFAPIDAKIENYCDAHELEYTRYADDVVVSGKDDPPSDLKVQVQEIITSAGWDINESKTHLHSKPQRLKVHGLLVNGTRPRLTKGYRKRIRAIRYLLEKARIADEHILSAKGHLAYAKSIDEFSS